MAPWSGVRSRQRDSPKAYLWEDEGGEGEEKRWKGRRGGEIHIEVEGVGRGWRNTVVMRDGESRIERKIEGGRWKWKERQWDGQRKKREIERRERRIEGERREVKGSGDKGMEKRRGKKEGREEGRRRNSKR